MALKGLRQGGSFLCLLGVLLLSIISFSFKSQAADGFYVAASWSPASSQAIDQFAYYPDTGALARKVEHNGKEEMIILKSFGNIPNLKNSEIEIIAAEIEGVKPAVLVVRHGNWVSVIDPIKDAVLATNIGPVLPTAASDKYNHVVRAKDGTVVVTFIAEAAPRDPDIANPAAEPLVFIVNTKNDTVGWFPVRTDQDPEEIKIEFMGTSNNALKVTGTFMESLLKDGKDKDGDPVKVRVRAPGTAEIMIDMKTGLIGQSPGPGLMSSTKIDKIKTDEPLRGMYMSEAVHEKISVGSAVTPEDLAASGNPNDPKAMAAATAKAKAEIKFTKSVKQVVTSGMKGVYGQPEAIDALARFAQQQIEAKTHAVLALGGPTGVGKTSGFHLFIKAFMKAVGIESDDPVFEMSLAEAERADLFKAKLFGSTPPYVGYDTPSEFVLWLLNHPDGGGILWDEIDKAPTEILMSLITLLEKGEVTTTPALGEALCKHFKNTPLDKWPRALREQTNEGKSPKTALKLKLGPKHIIGLGTNAGADNYGMNGEGKELKTAQDIGNANKRFTGDVIKKELQKRGYKIELLNRITAFIPFKMLLPKDLARVVSDRMDEVEARFKKRLVKFKFTEAARRFFEEEMFNPQTGARDVARQVDQWVTQNLSDAVIDREVVVPGDEIQVDVTKGDGKTVASIMKLKRNGVAANESLVEYEVGKPLPPSPRELLARARTKLLPTLEKRILGHRKELRLLTDAIITELSLAVTDPTRQGRPVRLYFDSTPGVGKTEIAKAVAEALFDDVSRMTRVDFSDVVDRSILFNSALRPMHEAVKTSPESMVMLWDELPRAGEGSSERAVIQNILMQILDEGRLPPVEQGKDKVPLPPATIIIMTGNLAVKALGGGSIRMTNRELLAHFRLLTRHPEAFMQVFEKSFEGAFRSRLGKPLLFFPLTIKEVAQLRNMFFKDNMKTLTDAGIKATLSPSAKKFFLTEYTPMEGGRWVRDNMKLYVQNAVVSMVVGNEAQYKGAEFVVIWNEDKRELRVQVQRDGKVIEEKLLAEVPRTKTEYHPETRERAAWKTSVHEGGHSTVQAALFGEDSVAEINTFGGGEGGWMEKNFNTAKTEMYYGTRSGIKVIAVALAGHIAELRHIKDLDGKPQTANGASQDFDNAREIAQTMLLNGSMTDIAPMAVYKNPKTGDYEPSDAKKREIELRVEEILEQGAALANKILEANEQAHLDLAKKLHTNTSMHMDGKEFADFIRGKLKPVTGADVDEALDAGTFVFKTRHGLSCQTLLTKGDAVPKAKTGRFKAFWQWLIGWFK